jgi:uncharacterized cupin superfamily protein
VSEHWALVLGGAPTLRHPGGQDISALGDIVCFPEGETGAHQFLNHAVEPARLLVCSTPVTGPSAAVYPDDDTYCSAFRDRPGVAFASATSSLLLARRAEGRQHLAARAAARRTTPAGRPHEGSPPTKEQPR